MECVKTAEWTHRKRVVRQVRLDVLSADRRADRFFVLQSPLLLGGVNLPQVVEAGIDLGIPLHLLELLIFRSQTLILSQQLLKLHERLRLGGRVCFDWSDRRLRRLTGFGDLSFFVAQLVDFVAQAVKLLVLLAQPGQLIGHNAISVYLDRGAAARGAPLQVRPTRANGQPAFGCYLRSQPWGMMVLSLSGSKVDEITFFADPALPGRFGLPEHI